ncbi:adhesion G-protein coupled receptor G6 isoform X1 [Mastacembelus armatus]|uniref:adhesion G-protein coupled receptor G6 isoform X1 n=1 Tax=Mastacembelus armatus TaxID=205130 RepID=UPI000E456132|nr:adhesion G-protein coupled receptor G6 isoform X1 [Mastacembelus armatus]
MYFWTSILATEEETTVAAVTLQQPADFASQSKPLASGPAALHRRHVFGLTAAGLFSHTPPPPSALRSRETRPAFIPSNPGRASLRRTLVSGQLSPPGQTPRPPHPVNQPRLSAPAPPAPPESSRPRPPASLPRPPRHRSSKTSLGFISTPLIWQGRKRPTRGRHPTPTEPPLRRVVHITKPELKSTARPTRGFRYSPGFTPGLKNSTHMLGYAVHTTSHLPAPAQPTSPSHLTHQPNSNMETPATSLESEHLPAAGVLSSPWVCREGALDPKESSSPLSSSSSVSNRKNKPLVPQVSLSGGENQTAAVRNWTEPLSAESSVGTGSIVYDAFILYELDAAFPLDEPSTISPVIISPDVQNQQFNKSEPRRTFSPVTRPFTASERGHLLVQTRFHDDSESLSSDLLVGSVLSLTHSDRSMPRTVTSINRSQIPPGTVSQTSTGDQTHHSLSNNTSSSGHKLEESLYPQAATQQLETLTFQLTPSLLIPSLPSLRSVQPTPSLPVVQQSSSVFITQEIFPKHIFSSSVQQQQEHVEQISHSSPPLKPLDSLYQPDGSAAARSTDGQRGSSMQLVPRRTLFSLSPVFTETSFSNPFVSPPDIIPHCSSSLRFPSSSPPSSSNTLTPASPLWSPTAPLPPSLSETDGVVESVHVPESGVSRDFRPSALFFLPSLLSLPVFSKAHSEPEIPQIPDYHLLPAERSSNNLSEHFRSYNPKVKANQLLHAGSLVSSAGIPIDPAFSQLYPPPSGLSVEDLASGSVTLTPDLPAQIQPSLSQLELHDPDLDSSVMSWPSSPAVSLSVSRFSVHSDQRDLRGVYTLPAESRPPAQPDAGFRSRPTAGIWASAHIPALLQENIDSRRGLHSASSNPFLLTLRPPSHHADSLSLSVSALTLPAATEVQAAKVGEETTVPSSSPSPNPVTENSHLSAQTTLSGSQDRQTSLSFATDPCSLQRTISHDNQVKADTASGGSRSLTGCDSVSNPPNSPLSNPSVMAPTQTLPLHSGPSARLGTATPQHASGLDYTQHSGLTHTNAEHPDRLIHTHSSAHTQTLTHSHGFLDASEKVDMSQRSGKDTGTAAAHVDVGGLISLALTPPLLSPSVFPSLSLAAAFTPPFLSVHLSPAIPPSITTSSATTPSLPSLPTTRVAIPALSASMAEAELRSLSAKNPVSQPAESVQRLITVGLPLDHASTLPDDKLKPSQSLPPAAVEVFDQDTVLQQLSKNSNQANESRFVDGPVSSGEASNNQTAAATQSHLSASFDPSDVVPKAHFAGEHASAGGLASSAVNTSVVDLIENTATAQPNETLNPGAALNTQLFPAEMQTTSLHPSSAPIQPSPTESTQPADPVVLPVPLHTSGLSITTPSSRFPTGSSVDAREQGVISGLPPPGNVNHPANPTIRSNDSTHNTHTDASQGNATGNKPTSTKSHVTISGPGVNSGPSRSNNSGSQSSGVSVSGAMTPDHSNVRDFPLPTTFKAVSTPTSSGGLKKATARTTAGPPTVNLSTKPALPCQ